MTPVALFLLFEIWFLHVSLYTNASLVVVGYNDILIFFSYCLVKNSLIAMLAV